MDFVVLQETSPNMSVIIQKGNTTLFYLQLPANEDKITVWVSILKHFCLLQVGDPDREQLDNLLSAIPSLLTIQISDNAYQTYSHILHAVCRLLEPVENPQKKEPELEDLSKKHPSLYTSLENSLFQFEIDSLHNNRHTATFSCLKQPIWNVLLQYEKDIYLTEVSQVSLAASYSEKEGRQNVIHFVENYSHFQSVLTLQARNKAKNDPDCIKINQKIKAFSSLSKALITMIDQDVADLRIYISLIPAICTFIVKNELENMEIQQVYLERLFKSHEDADAKRKRLEEITKDISNMNSVNAGCQAETRDNQLIQIISLISDHYLRQYDLNASAFFWDMIENKDKILHLLLLTHRRPWIYLVTLVVLLGILLFSAHQGWSMPTHLPSHFSLLNVQSILSLLDYLPLAILLVFYISPFFLIFAAIEIARKRQRWLYSQLLFPRLLGAVVVGLLPLLLNDDAWLIGIQSNIISLLLLSLLTCIGSFSYMFFEVNSSMKFVYRHTLETALKTSLQIFLIAFSETLFIVTIMSILIFPVVSSKLGISNVTDKLGITIDPGGWLPTITIFPLQILLWTGIALFIGSFVQLLWQNRRITESV